MDRTTITGKLGGAYKTILARTDTINPLYRKFLWAILHIDSDNGWWVEFEVELNGKSLKFGALSTAVRTYDEL